ncbi:twin-arginine translocation signal domain-containing protein [Ferrimonas sediminicola]|uniref:Twin-arginine translocation signal domain-containing protein n=1 Tax=Ferrimonas sediminicola TaxID=2569538 RepID=A0A4U1BIP7_9GAMM|nr:formate dehydrogenase subunit alpha [Ferrimonas sediminicola]TKB51002.1 twin-arginine translocation signal domain-containing protein [Ferrimonas sediminicola]
MKLMRNLHPEKTTRESVSLGLNRRQFLKQAGIASGGIAAASMLGSGMIRKAEAAGAARGPVETKRTICTHCSVGCGIYAEVSSGVWTGHEPAFDHPINRGSHCAKGASVIHHTHSEKRVKYPMKLEGGKWKKLSWEEAIDQVGDLMLKIRQESGPDALFFMGSAKFSNEQCYLYRKFAAMWGTNNIDHSARICHSTTVAGVANTWGYGAMTNSYNDMHHCKSMLFIGANPAEAHPVSLQHVLVGKERGAKMIVVDPRFTRTAAHADEYVHIRPGTDIPFIYGLLWHIFDNGWEDQDFIDRRVWAMEEIRAEVKNYPPDEVELITGVAPEQVARVAKTLADHRPGTIVWCMGGTQHTVGNANTRAYCILQLALGNMGVSGGGANIFRGHDNVQGATDLGLLFDNLPGYYGLSEGAWKHWSRVWELDYDWVKSRFDQGEYLGKKPMHTPGIPCSRWHDGVMEDPAKLGQKDNIRMAFYWGQSVNTETRGREVREALNRMDAVVVVDPYPTMAAVMHTRKDNVFLLPACTQFETYGSVTASNRSIQWRDKVVEPVFESKSDQEIMYLLAKKLGFADQLCKNIKVNGNEPLVEDVTREWNHGMWTIGMTGQSPERLKMHQQNWGTFEFEDLSARGGPAKGDTYGLPWPCWGTPELGHPGTHILYDTSKHIMKGGGNFRARFGVEYEGQNLLADDPGSKGNELGGGHPEFTDEMLKQLGWWEELTAEEKQAAEGRNWKTDLSGGIQRVAMAHGCIPYGNARARCKVWTFPDPVPVHREPLYTPRRDLAIKYPNLDDRQVHRLPTLYKSIQEKVIRENLDRKFPLIVTTGRLVEYEGGGEETRSNPWLAELQQTMFVEMNPADAADRGIRDGDAVTLHSPEGPVLYISAMVTERVIPGECFMPYHFAGIFEGESLVPRYPEGTVPYIQGESANTAMTYGYDPVTQMQETKVSICQINRA